MQKNPVCWWETGTKDANKLRRFFEEVFDWNIKDCEDEENYHEIISVDQGNGFYGGGFFKLNEGDRPYLTVYIAVDDIDAKVREIRAAGGNIVKEPFDIGKGERICFFKEPGGHMLAMIQMIKKEEGEDR